MALNNKNSATERLAHLLADATGESLAEAVTVARPGWRGRSPKATHPSWGLRRSWKPGVLNLGDALSYGVAADREQPLLFRGDAFPRTDIARVKY